MIFNNQPYAFLKVYNTIKILFPLPIKFETSPNAEGVTSVVYLVDWNQRLPNPRSEH